MTLPELIDAAVRKKMCVRIGCTTCGALSFRKALGVRLDGAISRPMDKEQAISLCRELAMVASIPRGEEAVRMMIYELCNALYPEDLDEILTPETWAGSILSAMRKHYSRVQAEINAREKFESPEAALKRRETKRAARAEAHRKRLEAKKERDKLRGEK